MNKPINKLVHVAELLIKNYVIVKTYVIVNKNLRYC